LSDVLVAFESSALSKQTLRAPLSFGARSRDAGAADRRPWANSLTDTI
jgi:hypothetical protein